MKISLGNIKYIRDVNLAENGAYMRFKESQYVQNKFRI